MTRHLQEELDMMVRHLLDTPVKTPTVARALWKLDDSVAGSGAYPDEFEYLGEEDRDNLVANASNTSELTQTEIEGVVFHCQRHPVTDVAAGNFLWKLDDLDGGPESYPSDWVPACQSCNSEIREGDRLGIAFGHYYHPECVPKVKHRTRLSDFRSQSPPELF